MLHLYRIFLYNNITDYSVTAVSETIKRIIKFTFTKLFIPPNIEQGRYIVSFNKPSRYSQKINNQAE